MLKLKIALQAGTAVSIILLTSSASVAESTSLQRPNSSGELFARHAAENPNSFRDYLVAVIDDFAQVSSPALDLANMGPYLPMVSGPATVETFVGYAARFFRMLDADQSGTLDGDEITRMKALVKAGRGEITALRQNSGMIITDGAEQENRSRLEELCTIPDATAGAEVVLFGTYEGEAISTVHLGNSDVETSAATVVIREGETPLYLVLTSYGSMLWTIEGNVGRLERVVLGGGNGQAGSGVTGVPRDKVTLLQGRGCIPFFTAPRSIEAVGARRMLERKIGRRPDEIAGKYSVKAVHIPQAEYAPSDPRSGVGMLPAPEGFEKATWVEAIRFSPAGIVDVDPADVVSEQAAQKYVVLPQGFGISQLVGSGSLERLSRGSYRISKAIPRFPVGLNGAHLVNFLLGEGVAMPAGSPGHSCVVSEETGRKTGPACPR